MPTGFGPDFIAARQGENYRATSGQSLGRAIMCVVIAFFALSVIQTLFGVLFMFFMGGESLSALVTAEPAAMQFQLAKATIVGLLPSSLLGAWLVWKLADWGNSTGERGIPLHLPNLGLMGWLATVGGLLLFMWGAFALVFLVLGIDPATYAPTKDGLSDSKSMSGMVEKIMADLSDEPLLFAWALPGVGLAVPVVEEMIFRGALFAALRNSWFGKTGAVIITAAAWSIAHGMAAPWLFVFIIFLMGLALGWLLLRFGSLAVTIACHACWNLFSSLAIFGGS